VADRQTLELIIQARNQTDRAFKQIDAEFKSLSAAVKRASRDVEKDFGGALKTSRLVVQRLGRDFPALRTAALATGDAFGFVAKKGREVAKIDLEKKLKSFTQTYSAGFSILRTTALAATAALVATGGAVAFLAVKGREVVGIENSFKALTAAAGESGDVILSKLRPATLGAISDLELMQRTNQALLLGIPASADGLEELASAAVKLGDAMGLSASKSLESMVTGLGRQSALWLDNLGIVVDTEAAYKTHAATLKKTAEQLTDVERKTAFYNATLSSARAKIEELGQTQQSLGLSMAQVSTTFENFTNSLAKAVTTSPALGAAMQGIAASLQDAFGNDPQRMVDSLVDKVEIGVFAMLDLGKAGVDSARFLVNAWNSVPHAFSKIQLWFLRLADDLDQVQIRALQLKADLSFGLDTGLNDRLDGLRAGAADRKVRIFGLEEDIRNGAQSPTDDFLGGLRNQLDQLTKDAANAQRASRELGGALRDDVGEGGEAGAKGVERVVRSAQSYRREIERTITLTRGALAARDAFNRQQLEQRQADIEAFKTRAGQLPDFVPEQFADPEKVLSGTFDWNMMLQGTALLAGAIKGELGQVPDIVANIAKGFYDAVTPAQKFAAIAAGVGQIGGLIGGRGGSAIQGAAGGAMMGMSLGGPIGAAIGGGLGLIGGLFGGGPSDEELAAQRQQEIDELLGSFERLKGELGEIQREITSGGLSGLAAVFTHLGSVTDLTQERLDRMGLVGSAVFQELRAQGMGLVEAIRAMAPSLDAAITAAQEAGLEITGAFAALTSFQGLVTDNESLVAAAEGVAGVIDMLRSTGSMTQETFSAITAEILTMFGELTAAGFTSEQAFQILGPAIFSAKEAIGEFGFSGGQAFDDLLADADKVPGLFDDMVDPMDRLVEIQGAMLELFRELVRVMGGEVPASVQATIDSIRRIPRNVTVDVDYRDRGPGGRGAGDEGDGGHRGSQQGFAAEGFVPFTPGGGRSVRVGEQRTERIISDESLAGVVARAARMGAGGGEGRGSAQRVDLYFHPPEIARWFERQSRSGALRTHPDSVTRQGT
jgi:hypothetical protein